jgi:hypothetical protein
LKKGGDPRGGEGNGAGENGDVAGDEELDGAAA